MLNFLADVCKPLNRIKNVPESVKNVLEVEILKFHVAIKKKPPYGSNIKGPSQYNQRPEYPREGFSAPYELYTFQFLFCFFFLVHLFVLHFAEIRFPIYLRVLGEFASSQFCPRSSAAGSLSRALRTAASDLCLSMPHFAKRYTKLSSRWDKTLGYICSGTRFK